MFSPRRAAQLGLVSACLLLVVCLSILVAGATDENRATGQKVSLAQESVSGTLGSADLLVQSK
jgi:hypothetical protein